MSIDRNMASVCSDLDDFVLLRFYGWSSPTLSLGNNQKRIDDINLPYLEKNNIKIVPRPSGGRAVFHEHEITYCIASSINSNLFPKDILGVYKKINTALLIGLKRLGLQACLYKRKREKISSPNCFNSFAPYEVLVNGKKIIGSAQRRFRDVFFQHGSILTNIDREKWENIFLCPGNKKRFIPVEKMNCLADEGITGVAPEDIINEFICGFAEIFSFSFEEINKKDTIYVKLEI